MNNTVDLWTEIKSQRNFTILDYPNVLSFGNSKINGQAARYGFQVGTSFDVLAGETCPSANECKAKVIIKILNKKEVKRIEKGDEAKYLCFEAAAEARWGNVYEMHKRNTEFVRSTSHKDFVEILKSQIWNSGTSLHRWHSSGDWENFEQFKSAYQVSKEMPNIYFYAYTKRATFYNWYLKNKLPNFDIIYSMGGLEDKYALKNNLPSATVITERKYKYAKITDDGLPIACQHENKYDDLEYIRKQVSFGLFVH
jgi:hypothetical protein